jgi:Flp pilus assembly protein TadD
MRRRALTIVLLLLSVRLAAKTLVLPLVVATQNHASYQWLGKAVSFYLIAGLCQNGLPASDEEEVQALLNRNLVRFPFAITKATAMVLAAESQADQLLWGNILYVDRRSSPLQVQLFLVDLKAQTQKRLPLVKGNFGEMYKLQGELLRQAIKALAPDRREIVTPQLNLTLPEYERFVKSLLLGDPDKKLELLRAPSGQGMDSDFVSFEVAKALLQKRDLEGCRTRLKRVADSAYFKDKKEFLLALVDLLSGDDDAALERFIGLQRQNFLPLPTHNDLGVIYIRKGNFALAEKCLRYALFLQPDPGIQANLILLLRAMGRNGEALQELTTALRRFPENEALLKLFAAFLNAAPNRDDLAQAFRNYVPLPQPEEPVPPVEPQIMNPYGVNSKAAEAAPANLFYIEARNLFLENDFEGAGQKAEEAMESNPFEPENFHLLALLSLQKNRVVEADIYAQAALFLAGTLDNYLLQLKVYRSAREKEKFRKTLELALQKFPQSPELLQMSGR